MGGTKKKVGKNRLDKYYHLAKEQGFRARSAFKLIQLNKKYHFLENSRVLVDLCAAPGGWLQVAAKHMPLSHLIIGVDLVPIKPIDGIITFAADITTEKCRTELKRELKTWKVDVFLNDGAPNVGAAWAKDAYTQAELVLHALKLASEFLNKGGWFVTKIFRSKDYNSLLWVFGQLFSKVEATKPASSRNESAEIFVVCKGFLAPKKIDPKFFEPKSVFQEINETHQPVNIFQPEKKRRSRQGYEDGMTVLYKSCTVSEFLKSTDPITLLGTVNAIEFGDEDGQYQFNSATTNNIKSCIADLKVLGKSDFKAILKWRTKLLDLSSENVKQSQDKITEKVEIEPLEIAEQIDKLAAKLSKAEKKKRKKTFEKKAKERIRMQLGMSVENDIGNNLPHESIFDLKSVTKIQENLENFPENNDGSTSESESEPSEQSKKPVNLPNNEDADFDSDDAFDEELDEILERQYMEYKQKIIEKNPYLKVKEKYADEKPFKGCQADISDSELDIISDNDVSSAMNNFEEEEESNELIKKFDREDKQSRADMKAAIWYSNPLFKDLNIDNDEDSADSQNASEVDEMVAIPKSRKRQADLDLNLNPTIPSTKKKTKASMKSACAEDEESRIEFVKADVEEFDDDIKASLLTPEGLTLALKLKQKKAKQEMVDDSFNKYSFSDRNTLPSWFKDDENKHNKPQVPITKEAVNLLKEKLKAINNRPIKKVLEAKGRQKHRAIKKLEAMKKKAALIVESEDITEKQKMTQIEKLMHRKSQPKKEVKLVVSKGFNKGKGRPKGVKGKYKMVDRRLKKDRRAEKARYKYKKKR